MPSHRSSTATYAAPGEPTTPSRPRRIRLRSWQRAALARLEETRVSNFLAVATPGAGKTTFALVATQRLLLARRARRVVIVVPTQHLKAQWADAAERFGLHLDPNWASGYGALPSDVHGVVVTYQQVAANPGALRTLVKDTVAILDEIHHAGESRAWGDGVRFAFELAVLRLCLSGTPFRSDQNMIPFVRYDGELARADYEYGYGDALKDRFVVRPVYFPRTNGVMEWSAPDGTTYAATFDDRLTRDLANQRLRTALDPEGEWLRTVLAQAHAQLMHLRARDPKAGGLIITMDQEHAAAVATILSEELGVTATVAISDDPDASRQIARFADARDPWIVAVRMVSEGVDIPRLRVGVFATNTITELFFRQAVGRLVRWTEGLARQAAYMFVPDDIRLRAFSLAISEQRQHVLKPRTDDVFGPPAEDPPARPAPEESGEPEQLSLFAAISALPLDEQGRPLEGTRLLPEAPDDTGGELIPDFVGNPDAPEVPLLEAGPELEAVAVPLPEIEPLPPLPGAQSGKGPLARRRELRERNASIVREIAQASGRSHAEINRELNQRGGCKSIGEATLRQLERRLEIAASWFKRL